MLSGAAGRAVGLGVVSGLRSMSGPAFVSRAAAQGRLPLEGTRLAFLGSPRVSKLLTVLAAGELVGDKLPATPSRTALPSLLGRAASGGLVGAAIFASEGRRAATGGAAGVLAAVAGSFAGEQLREFAGQKTGIPDPLLALVEDAIVLAVGGHLLRGGDS